MRISTLAMTAFLSLLATACTAETKSSETNPGKSAGTKTADAKSADTKKDAAKAVAKTQLPTLIYFTMPG